MSESPVLKTTDLSKKRDSTKASEKKRDYSKMSSSKRKSAKDNGTDNWQYGLVNCYNDGTICECVQKYVQYVHVYI